MWLWTIDTGSKNIIWGVTSALHIPSLNGYIQPEVDHLNWHEKTFHSFRTELQVTVLLVREEKPHKFL